MRVAGRCSSTGGVGSASLAAMPAMSSSIHHRSQLRSFVRALVRWRLPSWQKFSDFHVRRGRAGAGGGRPKRRRAVRCFYLLSRDLGKSA